MAGKEQIVMENKGRVGEVRERRPAEKDEKEQFFIENADYTALVRQSQLGDKECLNRLVEVARERLRVYVYRLVLDEESTQDIVQESMLEMFKILGKLKKVEMFWSWLYGIALNKVHRHFREQRHYRKRPESGYGSGHNRDTPLTFLFHPISDRGAIINRSQPMGLTCIEQDSLGSCSLPSVNMRDDSDVPVSFEGNFRGFSHHGIPIKNF